MANEQLKQHSASSYATSDVRNLLGGMDLNDVGVGIDAESLLLGRGLAGILGVEDVVQFLELYE